MSLQLHNTHAIGSGAASPKGRGSGCSTSSCAAQSVVPVRVWLGPTGLVSQPSRYEPELWSHSAPSSARTRRPAGQQLALPYQLLSPTLLLCQLALSIHPPPA